MKKDIPAFPQKGFYQHYKHDPQGEPHNYRYEVVGIARHTEDKTFTVLYRPLYKNDWFAPADFQARPLEMFMGSVEKNGATLPRFKKIDDVALVAELQKVRDTLYGAGAAICPTCSSRATFVRFNETHNSKDGTLYTRTDNECKACGTWTSTEVPKN